MKMTNLEVPYREQDLLSETNFLSFCQKHGLKIDRHDLKFFRDKGLIKPVVEDNERTLNPLAGYYSPYQFYVLRRFVSSYRLTIRNDAYVALEEPSTTASSRPLLPKSDVETEKAIVANWYKKFEVLIALDDLYENFIKSYLNLRHGYYKRWLKETYDLTPSKLGKIKLVGKVRAILKQELKDLSGEYQHAMNTTRARYKPKAVRLVEQFGCSENDILSLSRDFMNEGSLARNYNDLGQKMAYANSIDHNMLIKHEHPYQVSNRLLWLYSLIRDERDKDRVSAELTFSGELLGNQGTHCIYCQKPFSRRQENQRTCGTDACRAADAQATKKRKRAAKLYPWR